MEQIDKNTCYNCGKHFKTQAHLTQHKNRKTPCLIRDIKPEDIMNPLRCIHCNKIFSKKENLTKHGKICKIKNGGLQTLHDKVKHEETIRIMKEEQEQKNKEYEGLFSVMKAQIDKITAENKQLRTNCNTGGNTANTITGGNNNNIVNNTVNTVNIHINNYNNPSIEYLKDLATFSKLFNYEMAGTPMALINKIWFDPEHPENTSIHLVNKKTGETLVVIDGKWITDKAINVIPALRRIAYEITQDMVCRNFDKLIRFCNDMVPGALERNRKDVAEIKRDTDEIFQKLIDGRTISQTVVDKR